VTTRLSPIFAATLIFAVTLAAYFPAMRAGFIWNDSDYVTQASLRSWGGLERIWFEVGATQQYYPMLHGAFWLEHRLWGDAPFGYHLANILLHAASACLLVVLLRRLRVPGALLAGLIFALHPVCAESVVWISEQKNTLSTLFYLLAALAYLRFDRPGDRGSASYLAATCLFSAAILSKSMAATLPAALVVVLWWEHGDLRWRRDVVPLLPWFALGAADGLFTAWVEHTYVGARGTEFQLGILERILVAGRAVWFYLGKLFWPADLIFIYPRWHVDSAQAWQYLFPLFALAGLSGLWLAGSRARGVLAAGLIFVGSLFPVLGFFNVYAFIYSFVADHFAYLASLSVIAAAAAGWTLIWRRGALRWPGPVCGVALAGVLGMLTFSESRNYRDNETFYRSILAKNPDAWMAQNNLGNVLRGSGRKPEALWHYQQAVRLNPGSAEALCNYGIGLSDAGHWPEAIAEYRQALRLEPNFPEAHFNLGIALAKLGRLPEAIAEDRQAVLLESDQPEFRDNLANALEESGKLPEAVSQYEAAIKLLPDYPEAHDSLGIALRRLQRYPDAIVQFREALRLRPGYPGAHLNLGIALAAMDHWAEAIGQYQEAVRADPSDAEAISDWGVALAKSGRPAEAVALFAKAVQLTPEDPGAHYNLGVALQASGQVPEAEVEFEQTRHLQAALTAKVR
jgi:tetratricopeptide (TPR) repeat protein